MTNHQTAVKTTLWSIVSSMMLVMLKLGAGMVGHSYALVADAIESATDVFSSILVLIGLKYANKPADDDHPYGHGRLEPLVTFVVVGFLIFSAFWIAHQSIVNIQTPHELPKPFTLWVLGIIIVWKEMSFRWVLLKSKQTKSSSLKADAWHHRSDAITSLAAFIGILLALILGKGYESADDWAALLASGFILYNAYMIFRPAFGEIMDEHRYDDLVEQIRTIALDVQGVLGTEKCFIRKAGMKYHVDLHLIVNADISVKKGHDIAHALKDALSDRLPFLGHISIHVEPQWPI